MAAPDFAAYLAHYVALVGTALTPTPGKLFIQPGEQVAWDQCDCDGQGWARLVSATPTYSTPKANGIPCVVRWDVQFAVGVLRCVAGPTNKGSLPTGAQITADGVRFAEDMLALMSAIECDQYVYRVLEAVPLGPQGGCAGSEVRFTVRVQPCCSPGA
ncbi:hypothetical protein QDA04_gp26 [Microbacterium phage Megan]|uniref:Uncharacterized protein n=1 Tax=Microbacterium phage Megan TaxID=2656551 RepID=A0A649VJZ9_9CAUD|nr:hypothetical protein QDA04_gp26 [Microbacterium phage Megan]QGJ92696.1 hypothetical protein PBI_MEGAN_26 [Microbacterium phage Megan]